MSPIKTPEGLEFVEAVGVAVDSRNRVLVFGRGPKQLQVYAASGDFIEAWDAAFERPHGITIAQDDSVFLTDDFGHAVYKYSPDGKLLMTLGTPGAPSETGMRDFDYRQITQAGGPFHYPTNLAIGRGGELYVCDGYGNAAVHRFTADGKLIATWGGPGDGPGEFNVPHGIAYDLRDRVIVADRENSRLEFFDREGRHLESWTGVVRPTDVYVAGDGRLYVTELGTVAGLWPWMGSPRPPAGRISVFDHDGKLLHRIDTGFYAPHDIWLDRDGAIWMAEVVWSAGGRRGEAPEYAKTLHKLPPIG